MIVSIDPGMHGALAWIDHGDLFDVVDMPVADGVSAAGVAHELRKFHTPSQLTVVIEQVAAFPKNGSVGNFKLGYAYGVLMGVVAALGCEVETYRPAVWKKGMGLTSDKELSRRRAIELWPGSYEKFARKKDEGRAEAALLGRWYYDKFERQSVSTVEAEDIEQHILTEDSYPGSDDHLY